MGEGGIPPPEPTLQNLLASRSRREDCPWRASILPGSRNRKKCKMNPRKFVYVMLIILLAACASGSAAFAPGIHPGLAAEQLDWEQVNSNGFGDPQELEVSAIEAFGGYLYAGTHNPNPVDPTPLFDGARIYRSANGTTWTPVTESGFGNTHDIAPPAILDFVVFGSYFYASTGRGDGPGQIYRSLNGSTWAPMIIHGFSDSDNVDINALAVYDGMIYAGVTNLVSGAKIYRSFTGDSNDWDPVTPAAATMAGAGVTGFAVFDGALWATVESEDPLQIWQSYGADWSVVVSDGFGDSDTNKTGGMAVFGGYLYTGAGNAVDGAQLWRTDGVDWEEVLSPISDDANNTQVEMVFVDQAYLYASVKNTVSGIEVWRSANGATWEQVNLDGFGDSQNTGSNRSNASASFLGQFYVGTVNTATGGELWRTGQPIAPTPTNTAVSPTPTNTPTPSATTRIYLPRILGQP
jgi:hypothetical protein